MPQRPGAQLPVYVLSGHAHPGYDGKPGHPVFYGPCLYGRVAGAFIGLAVYFWFRRRVWTRDRFAFHAVASCTAVTVVVVATIAGNAPPWQQVIVVIHFLRTGQVLDTSLSPILAALIVLCLFGLYAFAYLLFRAWDGQISRETFQSIRAGNDRTLIQEALVELSRMWERKPPIDGFKPPEGSPQLPDLGDPVNPVPWRDLSRSLLRMRRNTLDFSYWRTEQGFWLAHHTDFGHAVAIKCTVGMPSDSPSKRGPVVTARSLKSSSYTYP